jgi:hypothetical protein
MLAESEAQDTIELLQSTLQNATMSATSRTWYEDGEILRVGNSGEFEAYTIIFVYHYPSKEETMDSETKVKNMRFS